MSKEAELHFMNCKLIYQLNVFIGSLIKTFTGIKLGNIWNQNLNFIVKIIPNQRVFLNN